MLDHGGKTGGRVPAPVVSQPSEQVSAAAVEGGTAPTLAAGDDASQLEQRGRKLSLPLPLPTQVSAAEADFHLAAQREDEAQRELANARAELDQAQQAEEERQRQLAAQPAKKGGLLRRALGKGKKALGKGDSKMLQAVDASEAAARLSRLKEAVERHEQLAASATESKAQKRAEWDTAVDAEAQAAQADEA